MVVLELVNFAIVLVSGVFCLYIVIGAIRGTLDPGRIKGERWERGECPRCGYDLRSSPSVCPECGRKNQWNE